MKMAQYTDDIIRFMCEASEYGTYHRELAAKIGAYVSPGAFVCDAGCGLGYLCLELSPYCKAVNAVDIAPKALAVLKRNIRRYGLRNIQVIEGDIACCPPERPYDVMVFCFFGETRESLRIAKAQCKGKLILIKRDWSVHRFSLAEKPIERHTLKQTCAELDLLNIPYRCEIIEAELGQPFRIVEEAVAFFRIYSDDSAEHIAEDDVKKRLIEQPSNEYPYYLPSLKRMGIIVIDTEKIPDTEILPRSEQ